MGNICIRPADLPLTPGADEPLAAAPPSQTALPAADTSLSTRTNTSTRPRTAVLSDNKQSFLERAPVETPRLTIPQVHELATHYETKLDTEIVRNPADATPAQVASALKTLSARAVSEKRPLAYLFSNVKLGMISARGVDQGTGHVDAYIATPQGRLLNLVGFDMMSHQQVAHQLKTAQHPAPPLASLDLTRFMVAQNTYDGPKRVNPQAGGIECASLNLSIMKEYLKDDAAQLRDHCLVLRTDHREFSPPDLMIPSPQMARYSQSGLFVAVARAVVSGTDPEVTVTHDDRSFTVRTLQGMVDDGVRCEPALAVPGTGDHVTAADLPEFRQRWLAVLDQEVVPLRDAMTQSDGRNGYLAHVVDRHQAKLDAAGS